MPAVTQQAVVDQDHSPHLPDWTLPGLPLTQAGSLCSKYFA